MRSTQKSIIPKGYTGRDYNAWHAYLQREIYKLTLKKKK